MKTFWLKELIDRPLFLPSGAKVPFEAVDGVYGLLATEDGFISSELEKAVNNHVGGVMKLTAEEHESWSKKKLSQGSLPSLSRDRESLGAIPQSELQKLRSQGLAAVVGGVDAFGNVQPSMNPVIASPGRTQQQATSQKVEPLEVAKSFSVPRVGKPSTAKKGDSKGAATPAASSAPPVGKPA